jgi:hypothetical protein
MGYNEKEKNMSEEKGETRGYHLMSAEKTLSCITFMDNYQPYVQCDLCSWPYFAKLQSID